LRPIIKLQSRVPTPLCPVNPATAVKISLVNGPAFQCALRGASLYGITTTQEPALALIGPPAEDNDDFDNIPDFETLKSNVPQEFHACLEFSTSPTPTYF
jgi:hypothetical protein